MINKVNILVTGCGGDIGQSIGKILNGLDFVTKLVGIDIHDKTPAKFIYPEFLTGLRCDNPNYITILGDIVEKNKIDFVIPASEPELRYFTFTNNISNLGNANIIMANLKSRIIGFDKLDTVLFLKNNLLPFPKTFRLEDFNNQIEFPVICKSREGSGSSSIYKLHDQEDLDYRRNNLSNFIVQEIISDNKGEFTCGLYRDKINGTKTIIFKRELISGYSGYGEVIRSKIIDELLVEIAKKIDLEGSINIQLRIDQEKGPTVFEINPRFSSTVMYRDIFGFKDLQWSILSKISNDYKIDYVDPIEGSRFYKGYQEYVNYEK